MKKWYSILLASTLLIGPLEAQAAKVFHDVPANHYAVEAIQWAENSGIISGDGGNFHPSNSVTETQFIKMYAEFFGHTLIITPDNDLSVWSKMYYDGLAQYHVPLKGLTDHTARTKPITRGEVARLLAFAHGKPSDLDSAVQYVMETGISTGQNKEAVSILEQFGAHRTLTRAQAVALLYRVDQLFGDTLVSKRIGEEEVEIPVKVNPVDTQKPAKQDILPTEQLSENIIKSYYLGGNVTGNVVQADADSFEMKFTIDEDLKIIGGYVNIQGSEFEDIKIGETYNGELKFIQNGKSIEVLTDKKNDNKVFGIYWHYTSPTATQAITALKNDTSSEKYADELQLYVQLVNAARQQYGLGEVRLNERLTGLSKAYVTGVYGLSDSISVGARIKELGLICKDWSYRIAAGSTIFHAHHNEINRPERDLGMLKPIFDEVGLGSDEGTYISIYFAGWY